MGSPSEGHCTFTHEAMTTTFGIVVACPDTAYARQAAAAAFDELDRLEERLSRYREGSDVFRINRLRAGRSTVVHLDTFECLHMSVEIHRATAGAFDVAYASARAACGSPQFELDETEHRVRVLTDGVRIDLGGIGKGFALDRMAALLADWDVKSAMLSSGASTIVATEAPPGKRGWPVSFGPDEALQRIALVRGAFSASGRAVKGDHIVDPHTGRRARGWQRIWVAAPSGAVADALSTAFMVMREDAIRGFCSRDARVSAWGLRPGRREPVTFADRLTG